MNFELIIDSRPSEVVIALLRDKRLIELHKENNNNSYSVGDIYLGKVKKNWQLFPLIFFGESQKYERGGVFHPPRTR